MQAFLKSGKLSDPVSSTSSSKKATRSEKLPWVEKYRPKSVDDVLEQNEAVAVLQECIVTGDLPNLLFYGPPGTGKTSTILAAARQLFGDNFRERILELNASDERGIQVIRDKVKTFAQITVGSTRTDGKSCPPFKIIILDEADSMTQAAQAALRRTMEREIKTTRFCLLCNYISRIIDPITSRCTKFRFKPLRDEFVLERLRLICKQENVSCKDETFKLLIKYANGDMRRAITCLQSCSIMRPVGTEISCEDILDVMCVLPEKLIHDYIDVCRKDDFDKLEKFIKDVLHEGYPAMNLFEQLNEIVVYHDKLTDTQKAEITAQLSECSARLLEGASDFIQLMHVGGCMINALKDKH